MVEKTSKRDVAPKRAPCGSLRELYNSESLSIAHVVVLGEAKRHMHRKTEEVYYVEKGEGQLFVGDKLLELMEGDVVSIPRNTPHFLKKPEGKHFEVLVITHPRFDPSDLILC